MLLSHCALKKSADYLADLSVVVLAGSGGVPGLPL